MFNQDSIKQRIWLTLCIKALIAGSYSYYNEDVQQGKQILRGILTNYTTETTSLNPVDLIFVLDRSASVTETGWLSMVRFVENFLEHFTIDEENARVAVITYSTTASVDIDGIRFGQYNKCYLVSRLEKQVVKKSPSGYSATYEALLRAKDVALTSRSRAKKAVIVITDGKSNIGPPPIRASILLRSLTWNQHWNVTSDGPQLQVYALGIKDAYMPEVRSIASPTPNHTFYIPTFDAFGQLARSLHNANKTESWQTFSDTSQCGGKCDQHAHCACGTRSGQYLCICKDGYQGNGFTCTACPRGTYKSKISPSQCILCPTNSTTQVEGATDIKQCVCQPHYHQIAPGHSCQLLKCQELPDIVDGHKFHVDGKVLDEVPDTGRPCENWPDSSCHFSCNTGYRLDGHPGLVCHPNGTWEGNMPSCNVVDCGSLRYQDQEPDNADVEYLNQTTTYSSVVEVRCHRGWRPFGDRVRVCTQYGVWSGTQTWCVESQCPALTLSSSGLILMPASCGQSTQLPGVRCQYICEHGYDMVGPSLVECTDHGTWDMSRSTECVDTQPPTITCAPDFTTNVTTANFAVIHWGSYPPDVSDNSGEYRLTIVGVANSDNTFRLTTGLHQIKYIARDQAGNEAFCIQRITVLDFVVHLVTCPSTDITVNMKSHQQRAVWPEVSFADSNNEPVAHKCVPANNTLLPPGIHTVTCVPDTRTFQDAQCQFKATFRQPRCDKPPPPLHGSLSCAATPSSIMTCTASCQEGYDFYSLPQGSYICDLDGNWKLRKPGIFWPDCSRKYRIQKAFLGGVAKYYYYGGNCEDENVTYAIELKFVQFLRLQAWEICGAETCNLEQIKVQCGKQPERKRRSLKQREVSGIDVLPTIIQQEKVNGNVIFKSNRKFIKRAVQLSKQQRKREHIWMKYHDKDAKSKNIFQNSSSLEDHPNIEDGGINSRKRNSKRSIFGKAVLSNSKSRDNRFSKLKGYRKSVPSINSLFQTNTSSNINQNKNTTQQQLINIKNSEKNDGYSIDDKLVITRFLYRTKNKNVKNKQSTSKKNKEFLKNKDFTTPGTLTAMKDTTQCKNCLEKDRNPNLQRQVEDVLMLPDFTAPVGQNLNRLRDSNEIIEETSVPEKQKVLYGHASNFVYQKRSVEGVTLSADVNADTDQPIIYLLNSTAPSDIDPFLDNVTPASYHEEDENLVVIKFTISKEILNVTVTEEVQSQIMTIMHNVEEVLNNSLVGYNLILDNSNATSDADNDNYTLFAQSHSLDLAYFDDCDMGYASIAGYVLSTVTCVACPAGSRYDINEDQCHICPPAKYQPEEAQTECLSCPPDTTTQFSGAHNISMCLAICNPGEFSGTGLSPCQPCPLHTYQPMSSASTCLPCPMDRKTLATGAVHIIECLNLCSPGQFSETGLIPCMNCKVGSYQPNPGATDCLLCEDGSTTTSEKASNVSECYVWNACTFSEISCGDNRNTCVVENNLAMCLCASGFTGASCEINLPDCLASSCQNNGTCIDGINNFTCECAPGFTGIRCEVNIDECTSSPCQHGGSCLDSDYSYQCYCLHEYSGAHCENRILLCNGIACVHGQCEEQNGETKCVCNHGYAGATCNTTIDLCSLSQCVHSDGCVSTPGHFQCHCLDGFTGPLCDSVIDLCEHSNCSKESLCIQAPGSSLGYLCKCHSGRAGIFCDQESTSNFDLKFHTFDEDGQYAVLPAELLPSLVDFTLCTWLRPHPLSAFATIVAFTLPVSLQVSFDDDDDDDVRKDNAGFDTIFSLKQTDKLIVNIFNKSFSTNITLTYFVWSHLCVTWSSPSHHWKVFINGTLLAEGNIDHQCVSLPPRSSVVIGQNNPYYAEASTSWDVYMGEITQLNIFSKVLSLDDIQGLANENACNMTLGDVISWPDVATYAKAGLEINENSHCLDVNECWFPSAYPCIGLNRQCWDQIGSYSCSPCKFGYTGDNCDVLNNECNYDVCVNGECNDGPGIYDFQCLCPPGYTGNLCEVKIDFCLSSPCKNGGTCISLNSSFHCNCPVDNMGPLCERPGSVCESNPCHNSGVCIEVNNSEYQCRCSESFTGRFCENAKLWCNDNVCHNGGTCVNQSLSLQNNIMTQTLDDGYCRCENGWMGPLCEARSILSCDLSPCVNGGSCISLPTAQQGYRCHCVDEPNIKADENCEKMSQCEPSPCPDNRICVQFPNQTYTCLCDEWHPCGPHDHPASNTSEFPTSADKKTLFSDSSLNTAELWTLITVTAIALLVISIGVYMLWRKKCSRNHEEILMMSEVDRGPLTNPGFQSQDLQLEESIYAELGEEYSLQEDDRVMESTSSQQSIMKSASLNIDVTYKTSSSPASLSPFRSSSPRKTSENDDIDKPLLSDDYLEPVLLRASSIEEPDLVKTALLKNIVTVPKLGVVNEGFNSDNYVVADNNMTKSSKNLEVKAISNFSSAESNVKPESISYVNGNELQNELIQSIFIPKSRTNDKETNEFSKKISDIMPQEYHVEQKVHANTAHEIVDDAIKHNVHRAVDVAFPDKRHQKLNSKIQFAGHHTVDTISNETALYVNIEPEGLQSMSNHSKNSQQFSSVHSGSKLKINENPGYISMENKSKK